MPDRERLLPYFEAIQDPDDWRNPIDVVIKSKDIHPTLEAISFFTGTLADVERTSPNSFRVTSVGYRNGPCGP